MNKEAEQRALNVARLNAVAQHVARGNTTSQEQEIWITPQQLLDAITRLNQPDLSNMTYQQENDKENSLSNQKNQRSRTIIECA